MNAVTGGAFVLATVGKVVLFFSVLMLAVMFATIFERKVCGFMQDRSGPNRVGPWGLLQVIADGLKNLLKEETMPEQAIRPFFLLAPVLAILPATILFAVIPFASPLPTQWGLVEMIVADVPIGFLYVLAIGSIGVYGVAMGGWASGSKYSLLGGLRGSAQMVSYEVALALSLVPLILLTGDVRAPEIVSMQQTFTAGPGDVRDVVRVPAPRRSLLLLRVGTRGDEPPPLRHARGGGRTHHRIPHRVFGDEVLDVHDRRVRARDHGRRARHRLLPRRVGHPVLAGGQHPRPLRWDGDR